MIRSKTRSKARSSFVVFALSLQLLLSLNIVTTSSAQAEDKVDPAGGASTASSASAAGTSGNASAAQTLTGTVKSVGMTAEIGLKELGESLHHLKDAVWGTFSEVQQPDMIYAGGPDVIGPIVIPAVNVTGYLNGGMLPPRKKWLDYFNSQAQYLTPQLIKEVDALVLPDGMSEDTTNDFNELKTLAQKLTAECQDMAAVCQGPKYENMTIATKAQIFLNDLKSMEKLRKDVYKGVKIDIKDAEKAAEKEKKAEQKKQAEK